MSLGEEKPVLAEAVNDQASGPADLNSWTNHAMLWGAVVLVAIVGYGILRAEDGILATAYLVAVVPALAVTMLGSALARAAGRPWDFGKRILTFVAVFSLTTAMAVLVVLLLILSAIVALFQACFGPGAS